MLRKTVNILTAVSKNTLYLHYTESRATKSLKTLHVLVVSKIRVGKNYLCQDSGRNGKNCWKKLANTPEFIPHFIISISYLY